MNYPPDQTSQIQRNKNPFGLQNRNLIISQTVEQYTIYPTCREIILMSPYPALTIGCFVSKTAKFYYNVTASMLTIIANNGFYFCCCIKSLELSFRDEVVIEKENQACRGCFKQVIILYIATKQGRIQISGQLIPCQLEPREQKLEEMFNKFGICFTKKYLPAPPCYKGVRAGLGMGVEENLILEASGNQRQQNGQMKKM